MDLLPTRARLPDPFQQDQCKGRRQIVPAIKSQVELHLSTMAGARRFSMSVPIVTQSRKYPQVRYARVLWASPPQVFKVLPLLVFSVRIQQEQPLSRVQTVQDLMLWKTMVVSNSKRQGPMGKHVSHLVKLESLLLRQLSYIR